MILRYFCHGSLWRQSFHKFEGVKDALPGDRYGLHDRDSLCLIFAFDTAKDTLKEDIISISQ